MYPGSAHQQRIALSVLGRDDSGVFVGGAAQHGAPLNRMRQTTNFANPFKLIWPVQSLGEKYSAFVFSENVVVSRHPAS
ncbi:hypothetical protein LQG66_15415 [Bradyrhizobium ontarionense]|uniref:Uncharacterized protein n=1 Tax=Bradyrhizobium ontarionense TaxID=2898149 RepID=A0ABY3RJH1_9BRAD|nr:hypothetical protein [Bradyrhizobium sp. A19]UFZ07606.1 hypothetical protein LQG66_15415 [Bradyrhizobium sp. A19]